MSRSAAVILFVLSALFVHLGCTVGPTYRTPTTTVESSFASVDTDPSTQPTSLPTSLVASPMTTARWWDSLHDPQLSALMDRVANSNLDVKVAQARVVQARAELAYASGTRYPAADVNAAYS